MKGLSCAKIFGLRHRERQFEASFKALPEWLSFWELSWLLKAFFVSLKTFLKHLQKLHLSIQHETHQTASKSQSNLLSPSPSRHRNHNSFTQHVIVPSIPFHCSCDHKKNLRKARSINVFYVDGELKTIDNPFFSTHSKSMKMEMIKLYDADVVWYREVGRKWVEEKNWIVHRKHLHTFSWLYYWKVFLFFLFNETGKLFIIFGVESRQEVFPSEATSRRVMLGCSVVLSASPSSSCPFREMP